MTLVHAASSLPTPQVVRSLTAVSSHCWCGPGWTYAFNLLGKMGLQDKTY